MKYIFVLTLFSFLCLFQFCHKKDKKNEVVVSCNAQVDSIRVIYYNFCCFESPLAIKCNDLINAKRATFEKINDKTHPLWPIDYTGVIDTLIIDCNVLIEIQNELNNLRNENYSDHIDARAIAIIYFKNNTQSQLCFSGDYANVIFYNDKLQYKDLKLIYLIKKNVGYYSWFTINELENMEELKDTTFIRDSITMTYENNPRVRETIKESDVIKMIKE